MTPGKPWFLLACLACGPAIAPSPSDDPADYDVDASLAYTIKVSEPRFIIPSPALGSAIRPMPSNNNVDIEFFDGRLFVAWRTAPTHFADRAAEMWVISSLDDGASWELETRIVLDADVREPRLLKLGETLQLFFFEAGTNPIAFEPKKVWITQRKALGDWGELETLFDQAEVPWGLKVRGGLAYLSSYTGGHYDDGGVLDVHFKTSSDGRQWSAVDGVESVYSGGVSETAFEFGADGRLWVVTRNEDGDASGYGSHVCVAPANALAQWDCPQRCDPERYDSPALFRHGKAIYLLARRDVGGPFGDDDGDLLAYSNRAKRFALYEIDQEARAVVHLMDLPGVGDTAFAAVRRMSAHRFRFANYTSPLDDPDVTWLEGQTSERGTQIYLADIEFVAP